MSLDTAVVLLIPATPSTVSIAKPSLSVNRKLKLAAERPEIESTSLPALLIITTPLTLVACNFATFSVPAPPSLICPPANKLSVGTVVSVIALVIEIAPEFTVPMRSTPAVTRLSSACVRLRLPGLSVPTSMFKPFVVS